ncbi:hypothetical protein B9479_007857 [Cryptococcus floricola]|uniref:Uncharacterized protein n=1 Tax=Cryptococcus floricola TaxID=2591691 RepID=A0A5D3AMZ0_9TREE|nr:hypothetical protein B9479_007857 [Cryptococcus floricola]
MTIDDKDHKNNDEEGGDTYADDYEEFYSSSAQLLVETLDQEIRSSPAYTETNTADSQAQAPSSLTFLRVKIVGKWSTSTGADGRRPGTLHPAHRHTVAQALSEMTEDTNFAIASQLPKSTPEETAILVQRTLSRMVKMMGFDGDVKRMDSKSYKSPSSSSIQSLTNKNQNQPTMSSTAQDQESTYSQMPTNASIRQEIIDEDPSFYTSAEKDHIRQKFGGNGSSVPEEAAAEEQTATQSDEAEASSDQQ